MKMADRTFGVEIEVAGLSEEGAFLALRQAGVPVKDPDRYSNQPRDAWIIKDDGSIRSRDGRSAEVVSPILKGTVGLKQVEKVCRALAKFGAQVNVSTGLHVHVGAQGLTLAEIETAVRRYAKWEKDIDRIMYPGRRESRNRFCGSMASVVRNLDTVPNPTVEWRDSLARAKRRLEMSDAGLSGGCNCSMCRPSARQIATEKTRLRAKIQDLETKIRTWKPGQRPALTRDKLIDASGGRYRKLNLEALDDHGTLEFRHHHGSIDPKVVCNWIRFVVNFVERSRTIASGKKRVRDLGPFTGLSPAARLFYQNRSRLRSRNIETWATA